MSDAKENQIQHSDPRVLIQRIQSLPKHSRIRISVLILTNDIIGGVQASFGGLPLRLNDMTSMGLRNHSNIRPNLCVWLEGFWGELLPTPDHEMVLSVVAVRGVVSGETLLQVVSLEHPLSL